MLHVVVYALQHLCSRLHLRADMPTWLHRTPRLCFRLITKSSLTAQIRCCWKERCPKEEILNSAIDPLSFPTAPRGMIVCISIDDHAAAPGEALLHDDHMGPHPMPAVSTDTGANVLAQAVCWAMTSVGLVSKTDVQEQGC